VSALDLVLGRSLCLVVALLDRDYGHYKPHLNLVRVPRHQSLGSGTLQLPQRPTLLWPLSQPLQDSDPLLSGTSLSNHHVNELGFWIFLEMYMARQMSYYL